MSEQRLQQYIKSSSLKKVLFNIKVIRSLKDCNKIEAYLLKNKSLSKTDSRLNLITSNGLSNEIKNSYFLYRGHKTDGSINPIRKYTIMNREVVEYTNVIKQDITIVDLYEESIYLHSCSNNDKYITGYLLKEEMKSKNNKTLIFSNEKIEINIKNINKFDTINLVDDFINSYII